MPSVTGLRVQRVFFPGNLLAFGTNPVRQVKAMDHWHLAPPDS